LISGILLASAQTLSASAWLIGAGAAMIVAIVVTIVLRKRNARLSIIPFALVILLLGAARYQSQIPDPDDRSYIAAFNDWGTEVVVSGMVTDPPDVRDTYMNLHVAVSAVDLEVGVPPFPVRGELLVRVPPDASIQYGDLIRLRGQIETPPENEDFSYRAYLARHGIHSYMSQAEATRLPANEGQPFWKMLYAFKARALDNVYQLFPDPEASLLAGILLGVDSGIPADLQRAFKQTGTTHIIAISGFNIAIIAGLFVAFFSRIFGKRRGALIAVGGIFLYTLLVGADASVVRAAIMGTFSIIANQLGRRNQGLNTLAVVAAIMALINPFSLWDVGFQLSFSATLGLILYAEPLQQAFIRFTEKFFSSERARQIAEPVGEYVLMTLAAQITTLPILAYHFHQLSLIALIVNPFVLPAQPALMIVGGLAVLISLIVFPLGQLVAWGAWPFAVYTIRVVEFFARLNTGVIALNEITIGHVIALYALLIGVPYAAARYRSVRINLNPAFAFTAIAVAALLTWQSALAAPDGHLRLTFFNVGSADAVLIQSPDGRTVLINGGEKTSVLSDALGRRLPPFERDLDWLIVASTQENQVGALPRVFERFTPDQVLWAGKAEASRSARELDQLIAADQIPTIQAERGQRLALGGGAEIEIVAVGSRGAVLLIEWKNFRALLPIGINFEALDELQSGAAIGRVNVLLLAESGYGPINSQEWIANLSPQIVVLSVAAGDPNGLPGKSTLEAVGAYPLVRTDRNGWITVETDGDNLWIEAEK
jgi:competence protein ComEC